MEVEQQPNTRKRGGKKNKNKNVSLTDKVIRISLLEERRAWKLYFGCSSQREHALF
jgi:hypothetical protein